MTGKEKYYQREEELSKIGYYAVLFMRHFYAENPARTKELCEKIVKENMQAHGHVEQFDSVVNLVDDDLLKMATKRFAFRSFDLPAEWEKRHAEEKKAKELARQKEREEVQRRVQAYKKRVVVKVKAKK